MQTSSHRQIVPVFVWAAGAAIAIGSAWLWADIVFVDGGAIPVGADAFYHARRILDTVADPAAFYEFDSRIHAPEGSWLTWPWGFDRLIALLTNTGMAISGNEDSARVLMVIPVAWLLVNVALMVALCSQLKLSLPVKLLVIVGYALLPFTQAMHSVGRVDHHFAEHTFYLLSVLLTMKWLAAPAFLRYPLALGLTLGLGPAIHNGLFILQIPLVLCLILLWIRTSNLKLANVSWFSGSLLLGTAIAVLPSAAFWNAEFSFYLLSWLHVFVACSTTLVVALIARLRFSPRSLLALAAISCLLTIPLANEIVHGAHFITGNIEQYSSIIETQSVLTQLEQKGFTGVVELYTMLILILPLGLAWLIGDAATALKRHPATPNEAGNRIAFAAYACFGGILMLTQMRFQYLGTVAMLLTPALAIDGWTRSHTGTKSLKWPLILAAFGVAYAPSTLYLFDQRPIGMDIVYHHTRTIFTDMARQCREDPGIVLADWSSGHHIRFHTECSVISNNMIMTPQHEEKVRLTERLLRGSATELRHEAPWIKYAYLVRTDSPAAGLSSSAVRELNAGLRYELLVSGRPVPEGYELISEVHLRVPNDGRSKTVPVARFFRIHH